MNRAKHACARPEIARAPKEVVVDTVEDVRVSPRDARGGFWDASAHAVDALEHGQYTGAHVKHAPAHGQNARAMVRDCLCSQTGHQPISVTMSSSLACAIA